MKGRRHSYISTTQILLAAFLIIGACAQKRGDHRPGEFVVRVQSPDQVDALLEENEDLSILEELTAGEDVVLLKSHDLLEEDFEARLDELNQGSGVIVAEPNYIYQASVAPPPPPVIPPAPVPPANPNIEIPNDPFFGHLWGLYNFGQPELKNNTNGVAGVDARVGQAWRTVQGARDVVVAVLDSGVDYNHPDLKANMWTAQRNGRTIHGFNAIDDSFNPMDDNGHGTHVAGTIGAVGNNEIGVVGVNWNVKIMALKFLNFFGSGSMSDAIKGFEFAIENGAQIINNSWGGGPFSQVLLDTLLDVERAGISLVMAAGNDGSDNDVRPVYPASYDVASMITVGSINNQGAVSSFSNYGRSSVEVFAPGENILSTWLDEGYKNISGTSMASPHVAGAAALILSQNSNASPADLREAIVNNARELTATRGKSISGGTLDLENVLTQ